MFTAEQAKRGATAYNSNCATCHGSELRSADREVPNLTDRSFKFSWVGKTIAEKFQIARDTMPPEDKHSLDDQVYLDIVSYILQFNKIPSGKEPLKVDMQILQQIVIAAPPTSHSPTAQNQSSSWPGFVPTIASQTSLRCLWKLDCAR